MKRTNFYDKLQELHQEEIKEIKFLFEEMQQDNKIELWDGYEAFIITSSDGWDSTQEERVTSLLRKPDGCLFINCYDYDGNESSYPLGGHEIFHGGLTDLTSTLQDMYYYYEKQLLETAYAAKSANKDKYPDILQLYRCKNDYVCFDEDAKAAANANLSCVKCNDNGNHYYEIKTDQLDFYIQKLISKGYRIAIFDCN